MSYEDNYFDICEALGYKTVIYGAGKCAKKAFPYLKNVAYICDKRANELKELNGVPIISLNELQKIKKKLLIVICIKSESVREEIKNNLVNTPIEALIFDYFHNVAFNLYKERRLVNCDGKKEIHYVHLICEDEGWILRKFAVRIKEELEKQGYKCSIGSMVDPLADINHHVIYASCEPIIPCNDTFMITHIDSYDKMEFLKHQLKYAKMGICMSRETMERLAAYGIPREKLCYINPAQDGVIKPKKYVLGITHKTHNDHRKNESVLITLCEDLDPNYFIFKIMGSGWDDVVKSVRNMGFQVDYYNDFDYEEYMKLIPSLDYYLFWGFDEGSMGYLDALAAGIETIVTPQGFHLDIKNGITYPCRILSDFKNVLLELQNKRKKIIESVETWTWKNYVDKHLEVWNYLLGNTKDMYKNQHLYEDGIFSVLK
jgi:hypothetical protein